MTSLWIVHREPALRAALARLAAAPGDALFGAPGEAIFDSARAPDAVLLGLAGDLEGELEFVHRAAPRLRGSGWILLGEARQLAAARRLFDNLPAAFFTYPPEPGVLREAIREAAAHSGPEPLPLSQRSARDALSDRFARSFGDLELPELLRALDPRLGSVPLLILGEPGTGRSTLARYVHQFGATAGGALIEIPCSPTTSAEELLDAIAAAQAHPRSGRACSLWLEDVDRLQVAVQRRLRSWIELAPPEGVLRTRAIRWIATGDGGGLDADLRRSLGGLILRLPPLRERAGLVPQLAQATALAWCEARSLRPRLLGPDALALLEQYPWPGNLRELESVVEQSLAASAADPLGPRDLLLDGEPFAPLDAAAFGALLEEQPEPVLDLGPPVEAERLPTEPEELEARPEPESEAPREPQGDVPAEQPQSLRRLAAAVAHEVRNPLTAVRAFAELLPERHADPDFRERFARLASENMARVDDVLGRLDRLAAFPPPQPRPVDVGRLLEEVLDRRRKAIHERRLLVLEELDRSQPRALCDPEQLRFAFEALIDKSLDLVPARGDLYLASKRHASGLRGEPSIRVLLRHRGPGAAAAGAPQLPDVSPAANALEFAIAELLIRNQGGTLALDTSDRNETVIVIDLPA
jgi:DNA-binding NtrC family response regulator